MYWIWDPEKIYPGFQIQKGKKAPYSGSATLANFDIKKV
jgi:hypothetical protein